MTHPLLMEKTVAAWIEYPVAGIQQDLGVGQEVNSSPEKGTGVRDRLRWQTLVNMLMNLWVSLIHRGTSLLHRGMPSSVLHSDFCPLFVVFAA
jgi:hypothetical protein